ncbi:MAG: 16S rRNA (cytidine(1402)-2'-O)-methyltransferase [Actinomycetota bacterium]
MAGTLWLVGTAIGNLGDLTERTKQTLARVDLIACEDQRRTRALLSHLGIRAPRLLTFNEGNEAGRVPELLGHLREGRTVAVVSSAGMPGLSDPGYRLVAAAVEKGIPVDVVPGPSAAVTALVLSGLPTDRFAFEGFLPRRAGQRRARLRQLAAEPRTIVVFESPRRLAGLLRDALAELGDRRVAVARELTKVHQEVVRGSLSELAERFGEAEVRGEIVLVIEGIRDEQPPDLEELAGRVNAMIGGGISRREAAARVARDAGVSRRAVYEASLERRG